MHLYDPVPRIESREPFKTGIAQAAGSHGDMITVLWDGASVPMTVRGKEITSGNTVNAVCIDGAWFALLSTGGYDSNEPKKLATWARSARASLAMRKILDKNPRWRKYYQQKVEQFFSGSNTASLSDGSTLPVRFGSENAEVSAGEMGLVSNQFPVHVIGSVVDGPTIAFGLFFANLGMFIETPYDYVLILPGVSKQWTEVTQHSSGGPTFDPALTDPFWDYIADFVPLVKGVSANVTSSSPITFDFDFLSDLVYPDLQGYINGSFRQVTGPYDGTWKATFSASFKISGTPATDYQEFLLNNEPTPWPDESGEIYNDTRIVPPILATPGSAISDFSATVTIEKV